MLSRALDQETIQVPPNSSDTSRRAPGTAAFYLRLSEQGVFWLLIVTAASLPFSIKGAERSWRLAFLLWLLQLALSRVRPLRLPLAAPLLAFVTLTGISSALSSEPYLSWDRMKIVCILLLSILIAQTLRSIRQVQILTSVVVLSGVAAALFTLSQFSYGIGVRVTHVIPQSPLHIAGVVHDTVITKVNGNAVHTPEQFAREVYRAPENTPLRIDLLRGSPYEKITTYASRAEIEKSGLGTQFLTLARGKPFRAQGTLGHYVVFAELLMQLGCLAWGLLLVARPISRRVLLATALAFAAIASALFLTQTRADLAGLAFGCLVAVLVLAPGRTRLMVTAALLLVVVTATLYVQHKRHIDWTASNDTGAQFRALMWEDGLRLVRQHPWFGVGMETVHVHWPEWHIRGFELYHAQSHFHSTYLQIAVERGVPALLAWLWFLVAYFAFLIRLVWRLKATSRLDAGIAAGVLAGLTAFAFTGFFHYNLGEEQVSIALYFFFGLALALDRLSRPRDVAG